MGKGGKSQFSHEEKYKGKKKVRTMMAGPRGSPQEKKAGSGSGPSKNQKKNFYKEGMGEPSPKQRGDEKKIETFGTFGNEMEVWTKKVSPKKRPRTLQNQGRIEKKDEKSLRSAGKLAETAPDTSHQTESHRMGKQQVKSRQAQQV